MLKVLPVFIATIYLMSTVLSYFSIDCQILSIIAGTSIAPLLFILISSFCFGFCLYHRIFIYYILLMNLINYYDWYVGFPIGNKGLLLLGIVLFGFSCLLVLYLHQRNARYKKLVTEAIGTNA